MRWILTITVFSALTLAGCGSGNSPLACFKPQPGVAYLNRNAVFVANTGSSSISAFQIVSLQEAAGPVCGSPFHVAAPPTALAGGVSFGALLVLSQPARSVSAYKVNNLTSELAGPLFTVTTQYTPVAVAGWGSFFYVANAEGTVSGFRVAPDGNSASAIAGSPFPAGSGPAAITVTAEPGLLFVANSQSDDVSGFVIDQSTGALTPLAGSPYPAGQSPAAIEIAPVVFPDPLTGVSFVFVANSGSNDVSVFTVSNADGHLVPVQGSPFPAGSAPTSLASGIFAQPQWLYVADSQSGDVSAYAVDPPTGALTPLPGSPFLVGASPSSVAVGDEFLYVADAGSDSMSVFRIEGATGATPVVGSPFAVGKSPHAVLYFEVPQ